MPILNTILLQAAIGAGILLFILLFVLVGLISAIVSFSDRAKKFDKDSSEAIGARGLARLFTIAAVIIVLFFVMLFMSDITFM